MKQPDAPASADTVPGKPPPPPPVQ